MFATDVVGSSTNCNRETAKEQPLNGWHPISTIVVQYNRQKYPLGENVVIRTKSRKKLTGIYGGGWCLSQVPITMFPIKYCM